MNEFIREREPLGRRHTYVFLLDDAAIAAALAAAESGAAAGTAGAAAGAGAGVTAGGLGSGALGTGLAASELGGATAPAAAELGGEGLGALGSEVGGTRLDAAMAPLDTPAPASEGISPTGSISNLSKGDIGAEIKAPLQEINKSMPSWTDSVGNIRKGDIGAELANVQKGPSLPGMQAPSLPMGGGSSPTPQAQPPQLPQVWTERMKGANHALTLASKLTKNKDAKQTLDLMRMTTGVGAAKDPYQAVEALNGPVSDIQQSIEAQPKAQAPRLDAAMGAPSTTRQPLGGVVNPSGSPATMKGTGSLPPTRLMPDISTLSPQERLMLLQQRGY